MAAGGRHVESIVPKEVEVVSPPVNMVNGLEFSPQTIKGGTLLMAGDTGGDTYLYDINDGKETKIVSKKRITGVVADLCWSQDGSSKGYIASNYERVSVWDVGKDYVYTFRAHDAPTKTCNWLRTANFTGLVTGSRDKTVKIWDLRSQDPIKKIQLPDYIFCTDVHSNNIAIGVGNKEILWYTFANNDVKLKRHDSSPLEQQHRVITIFKDDKHKALGYIIASTEGRISVHYLNQTEQHYNYTIKCHQIPDQNLYHLINDVKVHPQYNKQFVSIGYDCTYNIWDVNTRNRLKASQKMDQVLAKCCFNWNGKIFAYALSANKNAKSRLMLCQYYKVLQA